MANIQFDLPLDKTKKPELSGFDVGYEEVKLRHGANLIEQTYDKITQAYPDYQDNIESYSALKIMAEDDLSMHRYNHAETTNIFTLSSDNEVVPGEGHFPLASMLYDMDAMKGLLLSKKNGLTKRMVDYEYGSIAQKESQRLSEAKEGTSLTGNISGVMAGYFTAPETVIDFLSPQKIMGKTILGGVVKAAGVEAIHAGTSEILREQKVQAHMERAGLDYTLWDSTKEVLINIGAGGLIRGIGSGVMDWNVFRKIESKIPNVTDKEIFSRWATRENYKLTTKTDKHLALMNKARQDIEDGKPVDISAHTDIDINTKLDDGSEPINIFDEQKKADIESGYYQQADAFEVDLHKPEIGKQDEVFEGVSDNVFDGMATKADGEARINEAIELDPELKAEVDALESEIKALEDTPIEINKVEEMKIKDTDYTLLDISKKDTLQEEDKIFILKNLSEDEYRLLQDMSTKGDSNKQGLTFTNEDTADKIYESFKANYAKFNFLKKNGDDVNYENLNKLKDIDAPMSASEKEVMLNKYKYSIDYDGRILNSGEAEEVRKRGAK